MSALVMFGVLLVLTAAVACLVRRALQRERVHQFKRAMGDFAVATAAACEAMRRLGEALRETGRSVGGETSR